LVAIGVSIAVIAVSGHSAGASLHAIWDGAFGDRQALGETLEKTIPLTLVALGWIVAFRARRINIGFEGQIMAGGITAAVVAFVLARTTIGFRLRLTGANEEAARYTGTRTVRVGALALVASGAIAGLVGSSLVLGSESGVMADNFSANYGFDGIVAALLGRNSPVGCVPAALLFAALRQGGGLMEARVGVSSALVQAT